MSEEVIKMLMELEETTNLQRQHELALEIKEKVSDPFILSSIETILKIHEIFHTK